MNNLSPLYKFLLATFTTNPDSLIDSISNSDSINIFSKFNTIIQDLARNHVSMHVLPKLNEEVVKAWEKSTVKKWKSISNKEEVNSPFEFLKRVVDEVMILKEDTPYFNINHSEIWNYLTFEMGEDLFSTMLFADRYMKHGTPPKHFQWNYILHSNFFALNDLLKRKKINENHYHLGGSAPNVDLSWLYLMNNPDNQTKRFFKFEDNFALEQGYINTHTAFKQTKLYFLVKIAAYLRVRLFEKCCLPESESINTWGIGKILKDINQLREFGIIINANPPLQSIINAYKCNSHYHYDDKVVDYAIQGFETKENLNYIEIAGERNLYYCCLKKIFNYPEKEKSTELQILFYLYLLIKNKFCGLFIQRNSKYGFDNFHNYEETKTNIIKGTFYEKIATKMAITYNIRENYIEKLEARITPDKKEKSLREKIKNCDTYSKTDNKIKNWGYFFKTDINHLHNDNHLESNQKENHFYVFHFIKNQNYDWGIGKENTGISVCREVKLRDKIEKEARAINELRKNASESAFRIYGIDAASYEVNCRPEIFGQAFRYLSNSNINYPFLHYDLNKIHLPHLKKTYHAGEDFYDIVDGLRAIDEAVLFLQLKHGDRIGHGVALGIDPEKYYSERPHIAMPLQNVLDNYAWILYCIGKFEVTIPTHFYAHLRSQFDKYFNNLYNHSSSREKSLSPDLQTYMQAWKLRGDNPACYVRKFDTTDNNPHNIKDRREKITKPYLNPFTEWNRYDLSYRDKYCNIKENIYDLYHRYHFDNELKKAAEEIIEIEVKKEYVELVKHLQLIMRNFVLKKGVAIESNPSSNFIISSLDKPIELPVFKLFPIVEVENDLRLNVSINTDDQGVFYTSLVKEYTLLVGALQNEQKDDELRKYSNDKILSWVERLVDNSKSQCFMQDTNECN